MRRYAKGVTLARTVAAAEEERTRRGARQKHMVRGATCELVLVHCDEDTFAIERAANRKASVL